MPQNGSSSQRTPLIRTHRQLDVYRRSFAAAMEIFRLTRSFPREEVYALTSQIRRSSRSVSLNIVEAWRKRRYEGAFIAKLSDAESEAAETQGSIEFAVACGYLGREEARVLYRTYDELLATIVGMIHHADRWILPPK
jgi:four helix bundle protein